MANGAPARPFDSLTPMEEIIWDKFNSIASAEQRLLAAEAPGGADAGIRGKFLRWLLLEGIPAAPVAIARVDLTRVRVIDDLDLQAAKISVQLRFLSCHFHGEVNLNDAKTAGVAFIAGSVRRIEADRLDASGSLEIRSSVATDSVNGPFFVDDHVRLCGADIRGNLDLRGCMLRGQVPDGTERVPLFADGLTVQGNVLLNEGFSSRGEIRLNGAKIRRNLDCSGATLSNPEGYSLSAAGAHVEGTVYLCRSPERIPPERRTAFTSTGTLRLEGANIDGDLECTAGKFIAGPFCTGIAPADKDLLYAIRAGGIRVGANLLFNSRADGEFIVRGAVGLISAKIGDDFECRGGRFEFPGEELLVADGISVTGTTFLNGAYTSGLLRFPQAKLQAGLYAVDMTVDNAPVLRNWFGDKENTSWAELGRNARGIYAPLAEVGGSFCLQRNTKGAAAVVTDSPAQNWLFLQGAKTNDVRDDEVSWKELDRFDVNGCQYNRIVELAGYEWRLAELDRQYAMVLGWWSAWMVGLKALWRALTRRSPNAKWYSEEVDKAIKQFKPQPYLQLARAYRNAGYENTANNVLVHYQRNKTRFSDFGVLKQLGRWLTDFFLLYGFSPFRPVLFLIIWAAISTVFFELAYLDGKILPAKDLQAFKDEQWLEQRYGATPYPPRPRFNALLFAIDSLVPVVDFSQKKSWAIEHVGDRGASLFHGPMSWRDFLCELWRAVPRRGAASLLVFNTFFGWLLTSFFVAGVGGLLRSGREEA